MRSSSAACPAWASCSPPSSSPRSAPSTASAPPMPWPPRPAWLLCCASPGRSASSSVLPAVTRLSSVSSTSLPSAPCKPPTAAPSTTASGKKESDTTKRSSPLPDAASTSSGLCSKIASPSRLASKMPLDVSIRVRPRAHFPSSHLQQKLLEALPHLPAAAAQDQQRLPPKLAREHHSAEL